MMNAFKRGNKVVLLSVFVGSACWGSMKSASGPREQTIAAELAIHVIGDLDRDRHEVLVRITNKGKRTLYLDWRNQEAGWGAVVDGREIGTAMVVRVRGTAGNDDPACPAASFVVGIPAGGQLLKPIRFPSKIPDDLDVPIDVWVYGPASTTMSPCTEWEDVVLETQLRNARRRDH